MLGISAFQLLLHLSADKIFTGAKRSAPTSVKTLHGSIRAAPQLGPWRQLCIWDIWGRLRSWSQQAISCSRRPWPWEPPRQIWHRGRENPESRPSAAQGIRRLIFVVRQIIRLNSVAKRRLICGDLLVLTKYCPWERSSPGASMSSPLAGWAWVPRSLHCSIFPEKQNNVHVSSRVVWSSKISYSGFT